MGLEDLKRWHWAGIGLVVGLAFGGVRVFYGPDLDSGVVRRLNTARQFERGLIQPPNARDKINDVVVYPADAEGRVWMTFTQVRQTNKRIDPADPNSPLEGIVDRVRYDVPEPYKPQVVPLADGRSDLTVREYLNGLQQQFPDAQIKYRYAWEAVPANTMLLYGGAGLVLIGGVWPSVIGLLTGAGIWGPRSRKAAGYDLDRFATGAEPAAPSAAALSEAERLRQQQEMEDALLAKLDGFGADGAPASGSIDEDAEVRPLTAGASEPTRDPRKPAKDDKSYQGDFYPVARPGGKKDE
jgi:hypothetical protein